LIERERFIKALKREKIEGHVPTFELVFFLTMEAIGKVHPSHRYYSQWNQSSAREKEAQLRDMAFCYTEIAKKYHHSAIFVHPNPGDFDNVVRLLQIIRETTGMEYFICMHGDPTFGIPDGDRMVDFSVRLYEDPQGILAEQEKNTARALDFAERLKQIDGGTLLDGFALCSDYCFNVNPFFAPEIFGDLIAPVLSKVLEGYRSLGYYTIKHTDGNIMPIIEQMIQCGPDALHSLDPQGGVDLKTLKQKYNDRVCLIGNVNCGLLQTGTDEEVAADVRRALRDGMPGYGFIFSTSNCAYTGLALSRYEMMNRIWWEEGIYTSELRP
jgi:uroporphyrinogen decarboxylase